MLPMYLYVPYVYTYITYILYVYMGLIVTTTPQPPTALEDVSCHIIRGLWRRPHGQDPRAASSC